MSFLNPGYVRWDGVKYTTDNTVDITGPSGPAGPQGIPGPTGPTGPAGPAGIMSPIIVKSPLVITSYIIIPVTDYYIGVGTLSGIITISLPAAPSLGDTYEVKDVNGSANTYNITIDSVDAKNIDGSSTYVFNTNYQAAKFVFTGTQWSIS